MEKGFCIIPCFYGGLYLFLFSGLLVKQIPRALLNNVCVSLFTNHFYMFDSHKDHIIAFLE